MPGLTIYDLWNKQEAFYEKVRQDRPGMTDDEFAHSLVLHIHTEASELLEAVGGAWKTHVEDADEVKKSQVLSEVVDLVKLSLEVAMIYGADASQFMNMFMHKSDIVEFRRKSERFLKTKVQDPVVFDFDGVISQYPEPFIRYMEGQLLTKVETDRVDDIWIDAGISITEYEKLKKSYWETWGPSEAKPVKGTLEFIKSLYDDGIPVVIVTSRDRNYLEVAEHVTYQWLIDHEVKVDGVYFTSDKPRFIKSHFADTPLALDDDIKEIEKLTQAGINAAHFSEKNGNGELLFGITKELILQSRHLGGC